VQALSQLVHSAALLLKLSLSHSHCESTTVTVSKKLKVKIPISCDLLVFKERTNLERMKPVGNGK
jgi:hypothetical protein